MSSGRRHVHHSTSFACTLLLRFFIFFGWLFSVSSACLIPFAECYHVSTAPLVGDCDFRSGVHSGDALWIHQETLPPSDAPTSWLLGTRLGEASHPGPAAELLLGCSNPSGLRGKESVAISHGPGIWSFSETHLSEITQRSTAKTLRFLAREQGRQVRLHFGAPAPLRSRSEWAGMHTGVLCMSDFKSKTLQIDWPDDLWTSGRITASQHFVGQNTITVISIYGFPKGPTWPQAKQMMNEILEFLTKTFIYGFGGLIAIVGDFNFSPLELEHFQLWRSLGWISAQELGVQRWNWDWTPTCKGATEADLLWLSPGLQSHCVGLIHQDLFSEHSSIAVKISLPEHPTQYETWPLPRPIPWDQVELQAWQQQQLT